MRTFLINLLIIVVGPSSFSQNSNPDYVMKTTVKRKQCYVHFFDNKAIVYEMGTYYDKSGFIDLIRETDTLWSSSGHYEGNKWVVGYRNDLAYLILDNKRYKLEREFDVDKVDSIFNRSYFTQQYLELDDTLSALYPMNNFSFREYEETWKTMENRTENYFNFRKFADQHAKEIFDSIVIIQDEYVSITNGLMNNIATIDYGELKDGLAQLPAEYRSRSAYFWTVVNAVSKKRPEFYFKLANDFPKERSLIFMASDDDKEVFENLMKVEDTTGVKEEYRKDRRSRKLLPYKVFGTYAVVIGLVVFLIVR